MNNSEASLPQLMPKKRQHKMNTIQSARKAISTQGNQHARQSARKAISTQSKLKCAVFAYLDAILSQ